MVSVRPPRPWTTARRTCSILSENCDAEAVKMLVEALSAVHKIPLIEVADGKKLGEVGWSLYDPPPITPTSSGVLLTVWCLYYRWP